MRTIATSILATWLAIASVAASPAWGASSLVLSCRDGDSNSLVMVGKGQPSGLVCDAEGTRDGMCTFAATCPLCSLARPRCLAPCNVHPVHVWASVPVLQSRVVHVGPRTLIFRCGTRRPPHRPFSGRNVR